jgi:hypothetical protein
MFRSLVATQFRSIVLAAAAAAVFMHILQSITKLEHNFLGARRYLTLEENRAETLSLSLELIRIRQTYVRTERIYT